MLHRNAVLQTNSPNLNSCGESSRGHGSLSSASSHSRHEQKGSENTQSPRASYAVKDNAIRGIFLLS